MLSKNYLNSKFRPFVHCSGSCLSVFLFLTQNQTTSCYLIYTKKEVDFSVTLYIVCIEEGSLYGSKMQNASMSLNFAITFMISLLEGIR